MLIPIPDVCRTCATGYREYASNRLPQISNAEHDSKYEFSGVSDVKHGLKLVGSNGLNVGAIEPRDCVESSSGSDEDKSF